MARPPVVISNGGVASALTKGLIPATRGIKPTKKEQEATVKVIMKNLKALNARKSNNNPPVAKSLKGSSKEPKIYWRLKKDKKHRKESGSNAQ